MSHCDKQRLETRINLLREHRHVIRRRWLVISLVKGLSILSDNVILRIDHAAVYFEWIKVYTIVSLKWCTDHDDSLFDVYNSFKSSGDTHSCGKHLNTCNAPLVTLPLPVKTKVIGPNWAGKPSSMMTCPVLVTSNRASARHRYMYDMPMLYIRWGSCLLMNENSSRERVCHSLILVNDVLIHVIHRPCLKREWGLSPWSKEQVTQTCISCKFTK